MVEDVLLCGVGGQDTVLASRLMALVAMGKGMEARGAEAIDMTQKDGSVVSHVCIGKEIYSPLIPHGGADILIGFEPTETVRCPPHLKKGGCVVVLPVPIRPVTASLMEGSYTGLEVVEYLEHTADNLAVVNAAPVGMACGFPKVMNVALLGTVTTSGLIGTSLEEMETATGKRVPEKFRDVNMKVLKSSTSADPIIR